MKDRIKLFLDAVQIAVFALVMLFAGLKLDHAVTWTWTSVFLPVWLTLGVCSLVIFIIVLSSD